MKQQSKTKIMRLTLITINPKMNEESASTKRYVKVQFKSKRTETIVWSVFFGIGFAYFVAALVVAFY